MLKTFLFGIILYVNSSNFPKCIESILGNEGFFVENVKLIIIDGQNNERTAKFFGCMEERYPNNVVYVKAKGDKVGAYNQGIELCSAEYIHFTTSDTVYREGTFEAVKAYIPDYADMIVGIHTEYVKDINKTESRDDAKQSRWDFTKNLSYLPLYLNRYFIHYSCIEGKTFHETYHEDALKHFMIRCFECQSRVTIVAGTLMYYQEPQERNLTTYEAKGEKWWYIPQMEDMLIPMLEEYSKEGPIPRHLQNLIYYMIRMKYNHNSNNRYDYTLNYDEVKEFLECTKKAFQYIDDVVIRDVKNVVVTPKYMTYYFLKLKHGMKDYCPDIIEDKDGERSFAIEGEVFAPLEHMIVSLQRFRTDKETGERQIEAEWFLNYLVESSECDIHVEVNGKPAVIERNEKHSHERCFGKKVRRKLKFTIRIPKNERKLFNRLRFYVTIRGEKYVIKGKYARRKLIGRLRTRLQQGRLAGLFQKLTNMQYIIFYGVGKFLCRQRKNQVVMLSDSRESLSGNLAFIDKELKNQGYDVKYFFKRSLKDAKTLKESVTLCKLMATSKYILLDDFYPIVYPIKFRKGTKLIQAWHAMGAFKTVGFSRLGKPGGPSPKSLTHKNYTDAIASAEGIRHNYAEAFGIDVDKVHATGVPRTDIFFDEEYIAKTKERLYTNYPVLKKKKVVLFAPTFRGNGQNSAHYNFEWLDFARIEEFLGDDYVFVVKLHPFIKNTEEVPSDNEMFLDMSGEREINDLLFVTDVLITDYSSVIFEASLLNINTIFYVPDLIEYTASRDFYYPFEKYTFGEIAENTEELIQCIKYPANDMNKLEEFKKHFCGACDGKATKRFVDTIFEK